MSLSFTFGQEQSLAFRKPFLVNQFFAFFIIFNEKCLNELMNQHER